MATDVRTSMDASILKKTSIASKTVLKSTRLLFATFFFSACCIAVAGPTFAHELTLEDQSLLVAFDSHSGALTRLEDKSAHWTIERRPKLGISFRLFAPLPERRWNPVLGQKQSVTEAKKISSNEIRLQWKNLVSENGGILPMTLTANITLSNGELTFDTTLRNDSPLTIETIDYPYFGDLNPPSHAATNMAVWMVKPTDPKALFSDEIYPHFRNEKGYWGVFWPTKIPDASHSPFCLIQSEGNGVCVGISAAESPYRILYTFEQHPGLVSSITSLVPQEDEISGTPVHLEFRACHFIFQKPHSTMTLTPILLRCYQGNEHAGRDLYEQIRSPLSK